MGIENTKTHPDLRSLASANGIAVCRRLPKPAKCGLRKAAAAGTQYVRAGETSEAVSWAALKSAKLSRNPHGFPLHPRPKCINTMAAGELPSITSVVL